MLSSDQRHGNAWLEVGINDLALKVLRKVGVATGSADWGYSNQESGYAKQKPVRSMALPASYALIPRGRRPRARLEVLRTETGIFQRRPMRKHRAEQERRKVVTLLSKSSDAGVLLFSRAPIYVGISRAVFRHARYLTGSKGNVCCFESWNLCSLVLN